MSVRPHSFTADIRGRALDVKVTLADDGKSWSLVDLLGRSMGHVAEAGPKQFVIHPDGHAIETMVGIKTGPHTSLDAALAEIERHTRGACHRDHGEDEP